MKAYRNPIIVDGKEYKSVLHASLKLNASSHAIFTAARSGLLFRGKHAISFKDGWILSVDFPANESIDIPIVFVRPKTIPISGFNRRRFAVPIIGITVKKPCKKFPRKCEWCENEWMASTNKARFCCNSCSERAKGNNPKKEHVCMNPTCGKTFLRYDPPALKHQTVKYCSRACMASNRKHDPTDPKKAKQREYMRKYNATPKGKASKHRNNIKRRDMLKGGTNA